MIAELIYVLHFTLDLRLNDLFVNDLNFNLITRNTVHL